MEQGAKCNCPIEAVAGIVGSKWIIILMRDIFMGHQKFSDFLKQNPTLSNKVLTQKLKEMQEYGLIYKCLDEEGKIKYCLTKKGKDFKVVLKVMTEYGKDYCDKPLAYKELLAKLQ
jgi:DNA-binding HxlR family transcriptional regulator